MSDEMTFDEIVAKMFADKDLRESQRKIKEKYLLLLEKLMRGEEE